MSFVKRVWEKRVSFVKVSARSDRLIIWSWEGLGLVRVVTGMSSVKADCVVGGGC